MPVFTKSITSLAAFSGAAATLLGISLEKTVKAGDIFTVPPSYPFSFKTHFKAIDAASARRGYQVYREVCAACHSLKHVAYRHLIGSLHSEEEMKAIAADAMIEDGPNDEGEMFERPGILVDYHKKPYKNDQAAMAANGGALPPDLSHIAKGRKGGADYIFALLQGYCDPPAGVKMNEGLHFNPYFPGGQLGMARVLYNELIEYDDGTPATASQLAKDITTFLFYVVEPYHDERKRKLVKLLITGTILLGVAHWFKRHKYVTLKARHFTFIPKKYNK